MTSSICRRVLAGGLVALGAFLLPAAAPAATTNLPADPLCTLNPSGTRNLQSAPEHGACLQVALQMDSVPAAGQTRELIVSVLPAAGVSGSAPLRLGLPAGWKFTAVPEGFRTQPVADALATAKASRLGDGTVRLQAVGFVSVRAGTRSNLAFQLQATDPGDGSIQAWAQVPAALRGPGALGGMDSLHVVVGASPRDSRFGVVPHLHQPTRAVGGDIPVQPLRPRLTAAGFCPGTQSKPLPGKACPGVAALIEPFQSDASPHAASATCSEGRFVYADHTGTVHPAVNLTVEAWDDNPVTWDDQLASTVTDWNGDFSLCYSNAEHSVYDSGTGDIYLRFRTTNNRWKIVDYSNDDYDITTSALEQSTGTTRNRGTLTASHASTQRALRAFDLYNTGWNFSATTSPGAGTCWTAGDCDRRKAFWENGEDPWPHYSRSPDDAVSLSTDAPDYAWVVLHELGHNVMAHAYAGGIPSPTGCPDPHGLGNNENKVCAWTEGWPTWWAGQALGSPILDGYGGDPSAPFVGGESSSWQNYNSVDRGINVEARVMTALWDLTDSSDEAPWDRSHLGFSQLWTTFLDHDDQDFADFIGSLQADGVDTGATSFRSTLYGSTIDLSSNPFRDELSLAWASRPLPPIAPPSLTAMPSGAADIPRETSNNHNWVWKRATAPSSCGEAVRAESLLASSEAYRITASAATLSVLPWTLTAFPSTALTGALASASTGTSSLKTVGSLSLALPDYPRTLYLRLGVDNNPSGSAFSWGSLSEPLNLHYKLRGVRCLALTQGIGSSIIKNLNWGSVGWKSNDDATRSVRITPGGQNGGTALTRVTVWQLPRLSACAQDPTLAGCLPQLVYRSPDPKERGAPLVFRLRTVKDATYRLEVENTTLQPVDWTITRR